MGVGDCRRGGLLPEEPLCQDGGVERADGLCVVAQTPYGWDAAKLALDEKALGLVDRVLLLGQQQLLAHVVLKLVLRRLFYRLGLEGEGKCSLFNVTQHLSGRAGSPSLSRK